MKKLFVMLSCCMMLAACGGGGSVGGAGSTSVSGTASQGAALAVGTVVTLTDAKAAVATTTVGANGAYSIVVSGLTAPYVLTAGGFYSFASAPGKTNINPFTHLSMQLALGTSTVSTTLPANFSTQFTTAVNNLKTAISGIYPASVAATQTDFLNGDIAIGSGVDTIFDTVSISPPNTTGTFSVAVSGQQVVSGTASGGTITVTPNTTAIASVNTTLFPSTSATLTAIAITPSSQNVIVGATQQFKATGMYSDSSTKDITTSVLWTSSNSAIVTISAGGLAAALSTGSVSITATFGGNVGMNATLTVTNSSSLMSVAVVAGSSGIAGTNDGTGSIARFNNPDGITTDGTNLYVSDTNNNTIRKIVISTGAVTTIAGSSSIAGSTDGTGSAALFKSPRGITTDGTNLYVADTGNNSIRKIVIATGVVTTIAGSSGISGSNDGTGSTARFTGPWGITLSGPYLFVVDLYNSTIRKIVISTGVVSTIAGSPGIQGSADGTGSAARFNGVSDITSDGTNLYVTDSDVIRKVVISSGAVTTIAGASGGYGSLDGTGTATRFNGASGLTTDGTNLYVTDTGNGTIRKIVISTAAVTTITNASGNPHDIVMVGSVFYTANMNDTVDIIQ